MGPASADEPDHLRQSFFLARPFGDEPDRLGSRFHLAEGGGEVRVVTSRLRYDGTGQGGALLPHESVRGVEVHRVATSAFGRSGLAGRALDYASFYRSAWSALMRLAQPDDIIIAKTDPPLLCVVAADVARRRSAQLINWTQDLYPEVAQKLGVAWLNGPLGHAARSLRDASFRRAAVNVAIGDLMAERFHRLGLSDERVATIPNWVGDHLIAPIPTNDNSLRRAWGLQDRFVVGYSGNLGRAHEIETLLNCAAMLKGRTDLCFLFVGGGHQFEILQQQVRARGLDPFFAFRPYQDQASLSVSLGVPDVHWVSLRPEMEGLIVPSKVYGIAAAGRPILTVSALDGEIANLVAKHHCGLAVAPGDAAGLAAAVLSVGTIRSMSKRWDPARVACLRSISRGRAPWRSGRSSSTG